MPPYQLVWKPDRTNLLVYWTTSEDSSETSSGTSSVTSFETSSQAVSETSSEISSGTSSGTSLYFNATDQLRCEPVMFDAFHKGFELNSWGCISNLLEFNYVVKLSLWCSSDGSELNSWRCIFNPLEFHLRCEGIMALLCSWVRAELVGMHLQFHKM